MAASYVSPTHNENSMRAKSPFGYYGAKLRIARKIVQDLPPHNAWVEGFCGSAAVTLAKPPAAIEVINDADGEIVNFFEQLRRNSEALCRSIALTPYAREEFELARNDETTGDALERARRFLVRSMMTVNGAVAGSCSGFSFSQSYARGGREARVNRWYNLPERLEKTVERLRGVRIENRDARELVAMFADRPATLMYLDPPYFTKREHGYAIDARDLEFHVELLEQCKKARCMLLISAYETEAYEKLLRPEDGWEKRLIETQTRNTTGSDFARTEVLWMNARFLTAQRTGKVPVRLSKLERRDKKLNPRRRR